MVTTKSTDKCSPQIFGSVSVTRFLWKIRMKKSNNPVWANSPCENFRYCELVTNSKRPIHNNWQTNTKLFSEVLDAHNTRQANIGLVLGKTSSVIDIDCHACKPSQATQTLCLLLLLRHRMTHKHPDYQRSVSLLLYS
mgnify:CR=1 FL=1